MCELVPQLMLRRSCVTLHSSICAPWHSSLLALLCHAGVLRRRPTPGVGSDHHPHPQSPALQDGQLGGDGVSAAGDAEKSPPAAIRTMAAAGGAVPGACCCSASRSPGRWDAPTRRWRACGAAARGCMSSSSTTPTRWRTNPTGPAPRRISIRRKPLPKQMIDRLSRGGESVAIITAARPATAVLGAPIYDLQAAKDAVDRIEQSYSGTDLAGRCDRARQIAQNESSQPTKTLHLITDATRSAWEPANAAALAPLGPRPCQELQDRSLRRRPAQRMEPGDRRSPLGVAPGSQQLRQRLPRRHAKLWSQRGERNRAGDAMEAGSGSAPRRRRGASDLRAAPQVHSLSQIKQGGLHVITANLATDDRLKADDVRRRVIDVASELKVLIVEGERGAAALSGRGHFRSLRFPRPLKRARQIRLAVMFSRN